MARPLPPTGKADKSAGARAVDDRAQKTGAALAEHFQSGLVCAAIIGPSFSGKTRTAMEALEKLDPGGAETVHTSAAILNTNAPVAPADRSAQWASWPQLIERFGETPPKCVVIDEAGSSPPPTQPLGFDQMKARALLTQWRDAGTKFVVIGHTAGDHLSGWAEWLGGASGYGMVDAASGTIQAKHPSGEVDLPGANPVAKKNEIGAEGRGTMHKPGGNVLFIRHQKDD